jgi:hypothetical protein
MNRYFTAASLLLLLTVGLHIFSGLLFTGGMAFAKKRAIRNNSRRRCDEVLPGNKAFQVVTLTQLAFQNLKTEKLDEGLIETEINGKKADIYKVEKTANGYKLWLEYDDLETELISFIKTSVEGMVQGKLAQAFTFFGFYFQQHQRIIIPASPGTQCTQFAWAYRPSCSEPHLRAFSPPPELA